MLHNGNVLASIPVGIEVHMKEAYDNMKLLLRCINYDQYLWQLCGDLKVAALLFGFQIGMCLLVCCTLENLNRGYWKVPCLFSMDIVMQQDLGLCVRFNMTMPQSVLERWLTLATWEIV